MISLVDLWHAKNSLLVVTPTTIVRRRRNKVVSWPFVEFPGVTYAYPSRRSTISKSLNLADLPPPEDAIAAATNASGITVIYLNRPTQTFDEELIDDFSFGSMNEILRARRTPHPQRRVGPGCSAAPDSRAGRTNARCRRLNDFLRTTISSP